MDRRTFLSTTALTVAGTVIAPRVTWAGASHLWGFPESVNPSVLQQYAAHAIDAALASGASYADMRVADARRLSMGKLPGAPFPDSTLECTVTYGVRVCVNGCWAFVSGGDPSLDSVAYAARQAVATAAIGQQYGIGEKKVPVPIITDTWVAPTRIKPFHQHPDHYLAIFLAMEAAANHVPFVKGQLGLTCLSESRIFASSEGARAVQYFTEANVVVGQLNVERYYNTLASDGPVILAMHRNGMDSRPAQEELRRMGESLLVYRHLPIGTMDVGRYPAVFDSVSFRTILESILLPALELERVLNHDADGQGTSCVAPPAEVLGKPLFSPRFTLRALPDARAKWDDEGVEITGAPIISNGTLVSYSSTRQTFPEVSTLYRQHGGPLTLAGSARTPSAARPPRGVTSVFDVTPGDPSLDDLVKDLPHGILVTQASECTSDYQLTSGFLSSNRANFYEVRNGKIVKKLNDVALQFRTMQFFKNLVTCANSASVAPTLDGTKVPGALVKDVDLVMLPKFS